MAKRKPVRLVLVNGWGEGVESPTAQDMRTFLEAGDPDDWEHGDVSLSWTDDPLPEDLIDHDLGTAPSISLAWQQGRLIYYTPNDARSPRHLPGVTRAKVLALWEKLAARKHDELESEPWRDGDGDMSPEEKKAWIAKAQLEVDREFYDSLGPERADVKCKKPECTHGAIELSVFCRAHHFKKVRGHKCPFKS